MARLTVQVLPDGAEQTFDGGRPVVIGRRGEADVTILDDRASRKHAIVRPDERGGWVLEDHSANGTFSAGARVSQIAVDGALVVRLGNPDTGVEVRLCASASARPESGELAARPRRTPPVDKKPRQPSLGEFSALYEPADRIRIGRAKDNDIVVSDLLVSRHHAELRASGGGRYQIADLGSNNGVFVDGVRIQKRTQIGDGSIVSVGHHLFRLWHGRLEEYIDAGGVSFAAMDLTVRAGERLLLDDVSFALDSGQFLAVLGPTGAGKSTLLRALIGSRPADDGTVLYNGRDVYLSYAELRNRIGYVPQDDLLHQQLTVRGALEYAAALRFPPDVAELDRRDRVTQVMEELGLSERADLVVSKLSGGQRKRTSVAIELLTRPSLLVLDEPTSGLDPGYEKSVMDLLRSLADGGRTVITVTHSIQSLDRCDRLLFLAPGGQTAFYGPPDETLAFFGMDQYAEVFQVLDRAAPGQARSAFAGSPAAARYLVAPLAEQRRAGGAARGNHLVPPQPLASEPPPPKADWGHQFRTLVRRYLAVIINDRRNTLLLVLQAPILGALMMVVLGHGNLAVNGTTGRGTASTVLVALVLAATYLGASNSIREVVKEHAILTRELSVGVSPSAYVLSKAVVLGALTVVQALILVAMGISRQGGPDHGAFISSGRLELFIVVALTGLSAMGLGLFVSALVSNADKALTILPVILFAQFLMTGAVFNLSHTPVLDQVGYLTSARWGYAASASTADLDQIQHSGCNGSPSDTHPLPRGDCNPTYRHSGGNWALDSGALVLLSGLALFGCWQAIRPLGQPRRR